MFRYSTSVLVLIFSVFVIKADSAAFPNDIQKCHRRDEKCMLDRINEIFQKHPHGYPPFGIPDLEPFRSEETFTESEKAGNGIDLKITIKGLEIEGFSTQKTKKLSIKDVGKDSRALEIVSEAPKLTFKGKYEISGKILLLPIEGDGDFVVELTNPKITSKVKLSLLEKDGKKYLNVDKYQVKSETEKAHIQLNNLFNGDKNLGDNLNQVINENWKVLWDELSPVFDKQAAKGLKRINQNFYDMYPIDELFLAD